MRIIRDYIYVEPQDRGASAAIGNFDGVHIGHQSVIELARSAGAKIGAPLGVMSFEPHPREYFAPQSPAFRLMSREARATRLTKLGVAHLYELNFNAALSALSPQDFAQQVIADGLGLKHIVVGADFCFGKGRAGNVQMLQEFGAQMGFGVTIAPLLENTGGQRGRDLGYPTANMSMDGLHLPKFGVYAVLVDVQDGPHAGSYHGAASLGVRPMFGINTANLETFIFDFSGDLYGATLSVGLVDFLRPELKFDTLEELIAQMEADCLQARSLLSAT